jgi:TolB-like protein/Flp pilus assembly protein TadD
MNLLAEGERRLAAIMFTDMVGYTTLGQKNETLSLALVEETKKLLRPIFVRHGGREVKTIGDAFLVEFANALDAVRCAYDVQRASREFNISQPSDKKIRLRVGLHLGDVVESEGDIFGDAVNVESRIESLASDGGICVTQQVFDQVGNKFELSLVPLGEKSLKNVSKPVGVYRVEMPWEGKDESVVLDRHRIAVLPFDNISPDSSDAYFADGMTEEVIATLSKIGDMSVIARTSVMRYKGSGKSVDEIGRELSVGSVLEGSVRKAGDKLRITVQLIDSRRNDHLWSETYDRELRDIFSIQSEIAQRVAESLKVQLMTEDKRKLQKEPIRNTEAYSLYLRGLQYSHEESEESEKKAVRYLERSLELDSTFAPAYLEAATLYFMFGNMGYMPPVEARDKAESLLVKALAIDPNSADVHVAMAFRCYGNFDWPGAEVHLKNAIELSPSHARARRLLALVLDVRGKLEEGISEANKSAELDPFSPGINWIKVSLLYNARKYDEAITAAHRLLDQEPDSITAHTILGYSYLMKSMTAEAILEFQKAIELARGDRTNWSLSDLAVAYARSGKKEEATKILNDFRALAERQYVPSDVIAVIHLVLGDKVQAFQWFEKAHDQRSQAWIQWLGVDPLFDDFRADQRFISFLKKVGF